MTVAAATTDRRVWLAPVFLAVVLIGLLVTSGVLWSRHREAIDPGVLVVSREEAVSFFSLDYRHPDEDVGRVLDLATGAFKKQYAAGRYEIASGIRHKKLIVTASVPPDGAAVEYQRGDRAQTVVAVDVTTTTAKGAKASGRYRTRLELTRVDGSWLVSGLKQVG